MDNASQPSPLAGVLSGILANCKTKAALGAEADRLNAQITSLTTERDTARNEAKIAADALAVEKLKLEAVAGFFGVSVAELSEKGPQLLADKIATSAADQIAAMGVPAPELPKAEAEPKPSKQSIIDEMNSIKDPGERAAFIKAHRKEIYS